jgi:hypothetical protein
VQTKTPAFVARRGLRGGHRQTLASFFLLRRIALPPAEARLIEVEPVVHVRVHCHWQSDRQNALTVIIVHGLEEPLFRADFVNPTATLDTNRGTKVNPTIPLYFYDIADRPKVMEVVRKEMIYSWDIPVYFGETDRYVVVTSPG